VNNVAQGIGQTYVQLCLNESVHIIEIYAQDEVVSDVSFEINLESPATLLRTGEFLDVGEPVFLLFDMDNLICDSSQYSIEALFDFGLDPASYEVSLSELNVTTLSTTVLAVGDGTGLDICLPCGTYQFEAFACESDDTTGTKFQTFQDDTISFNTTGFYLGTSYILELECFDVSPTSAPTPACAANQSFVEMIIDFDTKPDETEWSLIHVDSESFDSTLVNDGGSESLTQMCLECDEQYILSVTDCGGDGLCCAWGYGRYVLLQEGTTTLASGADFGYSSRNYFTVSC